MTISHYLLHLRAILVLASSVSVHCLSFSPNHENGHSVIAKYDAMLTNYKQNDVMYHPTTSTYIYDTFDDPGAASRSLKQDISPKDTKELAEDSNALYKKILEARARGQGMQIGATSIFLSAFSLIYIFFEIIGLSLLRHRVEGKTDSYFGYMFFFFIGSILHLIYRCRKVFYRRKSYAKYENKIETPGDVNNQLYTKLSRNSYFDLGPFFRSATNKTLLMLLASFGLFMKGLGAVVITGVKVFADRAVGSISLTNDFKLLKTNPAKFFYKNKFQYYSFFSGLVFLLISIAPLVYFYRKFFDDNSEMYQAPKHELFDVSVAI